MGKAKRKKKATRTPRPTAAAAGKLVVEAVPLRKLRPAPYNPRVDLQPGDPEYDKLKRSFERFGYVDGVIWNRRTGHVVGGHQRLKVLRDLGLGDADAIDVQVVDLAEADEKTLNVALNKIAGDWEQERLAELLVQIQQNTDADVTVSGFDSSEIEATIRSVLKDAEDEPPQPEKTFKPAYGVLVECRDEADQKVVYDLMQQRGYSCRVLTL